jgi:hypothetical protein
MPLAPIALFVYNRLWHTQQTVEALQKNHLAPESDLVIFSDGPKSDAARAQVEAVRQYLHTITGFRSVAVVGRPENQGLSRSVIAGVTEVVNRYGKVIVLEDDLVTSPHFLSYMNQALDLYEFEDKIISVHAYIYPVAVQLPATFFLRGADCWGWATWKRGWDLFEPDGKKLLDALTNQRLIHAFDFEGAYPYSRMLAEQVAGQNDSWAVRWYATAFLCDKLTLYPGQSLIHNIGNDNSGTHSEATAHYDTRASDQPVVIDPQVPIAESAAAKRAIGHYLKYANASPLKKLIYRLSRTVYERNS